MSEVHKPNDSERGENMLFEKLKYITINTFPSMDTQYTDTRYLGFGA
jgi:hypothetical protein